MTKNNSSLTFLELTENLAYLKVIWNGKIIYDDIDGEETVSSLMCMKRKYDNLLVYDLDIKVVQFHHCILTVIGDVPEEDTLGIKATWEINYDGWYPYCSNCLKEPYEYLQTHNNILPNRCPTCGATITNANELNKRE